MSNRLSNRFTEKEQAAAKQFLNWIVYSEIGPFKNNPYELSDPLSRDLYEKVHDQKVFSVSVIVPNDHWAVLGAAMQKYLAGRSDRAELMESIQDYWDEQE